MGGVPTDQPPLSLPAPTGPVALAGHSMGGMSVLAPARQRLELFGDRVVGGFLLATAAGGLVQTGVLGLAITVIRTLRLLSLYLRFLQLIAPLLERFRRRGTPARPTGHPTAAVRCRRRRSGQRPAG
jgi:pimeloyl-ACP methyl ester carboxylesterase